MPAHRLPWSLLQAALAPGLPDDLEAVLGKLNTYCQCMHGAAGAVAGCGLHPSLSLAPCHAFSQGVSALRGWMGPACFAVDHVKVSSLGMVTAGKAPAVHQVDNGV